MQTLFKLLRKYYFFLLFILFEVISLYIYFSHFDERRISLLNSTSVITGSVYEQYHNLQEYFYLKHENEMLARSNKQLREKISRLATSEGKKPVTHQPASFDYIPAQVINNTVNKNHNYLTLNKGLNDSIRPEMGIIAPSGLVGIIRDVSEHYSLAISLLNIRLGISAKIKQNDYYGSVKWDGNNPQLAKLNEIPNYTSIEIGDTVATSGYSAIFPEGVPIGTVKTYQKKPNTNFYDITIDLFVDFRRLNHVQVIKNQLQQERKTLENIYETEE